MNERDELRGTFSNTICNVSNYPPKAMPYLLGGDMSEVLDRTADAILAAGYRKPRTITTAEELDALPVGSVVRSAMGVVYEKNADLDDLDDLSLAWLEPIGDSRRYPARRLSYPATVLWEPR